MERLFSPWRSKYIESFAHEKDANNQCILCGPLNEPDDEKQLIITRGKFCYVIMNLYPYNSGHLMVVPNRHIAMLNELSQDETCEIMELLKKMMGVLQNVSRPEGFNIGSNIGRAAGAGIDQHIHFHIVPRWSGDTNFMPILSDTKMISEDMRETWQKIRSAL